MRELEKYVQENFPDELEKVRRDFANELPRLSDAEKTIIYKYTDNDFTYVDVNEILRDSEGLVIPDFAMREVSTIMKKKSFSEKGHHLKF